MTPRKAPKEVKTQPIYEAKDLAALWRTGELGKLATIFQNQLNQYWNMGMFDIYGKYKMGKIGKAEFVRKVFLTYIIPGLMIGMIAKSRLPTKTREGVTDVAEMGIAQIPVIGAMILSVLRGWDVSAGITFEPFEQAGYAGQRWLAMGKKPTKENLEKAIRQSIIASGYLAGFPTGQPKRVADAIIKQAEGNLDDWMEYIWGSYVRGQATSGGKTGKSITPKTNIELKWK